jgi:hypothetical protein
MSVGYRLGAAVLAAVALGACHPKGHNVPLEEAMNHVSRPVIQERVRVRPAPEPMPQEPIAIAGGEWIATSTTYTLPARYVRPIGTSGGLNFYVLSWDDEPFDRLLVPSRTRPGHWVEFAEVY